MDNTKDTKQGKPKQTRSRWNDSEEILLLQLWEDKLPELRSNRRNSHVRAEIAEAMRQQRGSKFAPCQIRIKMHNFTNRYRYEKKQFGLASNWCYYKQMHRFLGAYEADYSESMDEESIEMPDIKYETDPVRTCSPASSTSSPLLIQLPAHEDEESSIEEPPTKRLNTGHTLQESLLEELKLSNRNILKEMAAMRKESKAALKLQRELVALEKRRNDMLETFLEVLKNKQ